MLGSEPTNPFKEVFAQRSTGPKSTKSSTENSEQSANIFTNENDTQENDTQGNDTQENDTQENDTQENDTQGNDRVFESDTNPQPVPPENIVHLFQNGNEDGDTNPSPGTPENFVHFEINGNEDGDTNPQPVTPVNFETNGNEAGDTNPNFNKAENLPHIDDFGDFEDFGKRLFPRIPLPNTKTFPKYSSNTKGGSKNDKALPPAITLHNTKKFGTTDSSNTKGKDGKDGKDANAEKKIVVEKKPNEFTLPTPEINGVDIESSPEDFFRDFREYLDNTIESFRATVNQTHALLSSELTTQITALHDDVMFALSNIQSTLVSEMMDVRYISQPPDLALLTITNRCEHQHIPYFENLESFLMALSKDNTGNFANTITCKQGDVWQVMQQDGNKEKQYFIVVSCLFHHYQVENLMYVSVLSRTRIMVEGKDGKDHLMFCYLLKRGF
jgi:hypothetical protein